MHPEQLTQQPSGGLAWIQPSKRDKLKTLMKQRADLDTMLAKIVMEGS